ncbi:MAG: molybdopterin-dependent oxidoreductase [Eggerthellaceae bacterium]|nr:molybdopterin-dependent oxidoreductase [Eggerthellaceae bacterium]
MSGDAKPKSGLTRRSFLKATGAVAGAAAVAGAGGSLRSVVAAADENSVDEQVFHSACLPNCENTCRLKITVRDGKLVKVTAGDLPNNEYKRICLKGMTHAFRTYHPDRVKYPLRRVGERGSGEWERISWDEAIKEITDNWKSIQERYGKKAIIIFGNSGNVRFSTYSGLPTKFMNVMECTRASVIFDCNATAGFTRTIGSEFSSFWNQNEIVDLKNAKNLFVWGANMPDSQPQNWHFMREAQEGGTKMWFINPKFSIGAAKADEYVPIRCGSDTAVLMAMIRTILQNGWIDEDFCREHTVAPFLVREDTGKFLRGDVLGGSEDSYLVMDGETGMPSDSAEAADPALLGSFEVNGISVKTALTLLQEAVANFTSEYAEGLSSVPASKIEEMAEVYALDGPNTTFTLFGPDRFYNGHFFTHALATLAGITGNIGKPGACIGEHVLWGHINGGVLNTPTGTTASAMTGCEILDTIVTGQNRGKDYPIKAIYAYSSNFIGNLPDQQKWIEALTTPGVVEHFAVADFRLTDTTRYADIVLPPCYWFEYEDAAGNATHPYAIMMEKCIDPLYESKTDVEIFNLLAEAMGFGEHFQQSDIEYTKDVLDKCPAAVKFNVSLERLRKEGAVRCIPGDDERPYIYAEGGVFPTKSGRLEFYCESPTSSIGSADFNPDEEHLPRFITPIEAWPENDLYQKYPLVFLQDHTRWRMHTQWSHDVLLKELDPEPVVYLSPQDAEKRGISRGDMVRVFNDRGQMIVKALINRGIPEGIINCPKGWQRDQYAGYGSFQDLTHGQISPVSGNQIQFDVLVDVEPYQGGDQ